MYADHGVMGMSAFMERSYRIAADGRTVLCDAVASRPEIDVLGEAMAWRRDELSRVGMQEVEAVLALRALMTLEDLLGAAAGDLAILSLTRDQALTLCEVAGSYVTERDVESYQSPEERDRIARLRALAGPLMDTCCELAAAEDEARERLLTV
jgi:hypothetical protein